MIKNGPFSNGMTGYEVYVADDANASYVVDSLTEDNALDVTVNKTADADWKVQIKQNNINLVEGETYRLSFTAKSSLGRPIRVILQGDEQHGYAKGKVTYQKASGASQLAVAAATGRVTVKKGTKAGTYTAKVTVKAAGDASHKPLSKTVTVKVVVK